MRRFFSRLSLARSFHLWLGTTGKVLLVQLDTFSGLKGRLHGQILPQKGKNLSAFLELNLWDPLPYNSKMYAETILWLD